MVIPPPSLGILFIRAEPQLGPGGMEKSSAAEGG